MDKISINALFPALDFQPLDINSLYNLKPQKIKNQINFNINKLKNLREERKQKILIQYDKILNICLNKINFANNFDKTETIFDIPKALYGYFDYNPLDCAKYIQSKLTDLKLKSVILSNITIYISWED